MKSSIIVIGVMIIFSCSSSIAQQSVPDDNSEHEGHSSHSDMNELSIFTGVTSLLNDQGTYFTLGIDYIHVFPPNGDFGIGMFSEAIFAEHTEWLFAALGYWKFYKHFWIRTGPGIEIPQEPEHEADPHDTGDPAGHEATKSVTEFLYRIGAGYGFNIGNLWITPSMDLDFVRSTVSLVWGVNIGIGF